ncbi:MAG: hypothetical protein ABJA89_18380 [Lapillicoccus sp.]
MGTRLAVVVAVAGLSWAAAPSAQAARTAPAAPAAEAAAAGVAGVVGDTAGIVTVLNSPVGFQRLIDEITTQVHAQYPRATLRSIVGTSPSGPTTSIRDVTAWQLNFNDVDATGRNMIVRGAVLLPYRTVVVTTIQNATVYSRELTQPVALSPHLATVLVRAAGYREPFRSVFYAQPIGRATAYPHPLAVVDPGGDLIGVDTVTRAVAPFRYSIGPVG